MTTEKLELFIAELIKWNKSINLIQEHTVEKLYERHILNSLELKPYLDYNNDVIVDIGSGAGFPALILAIDGAKDVHLVEPVEKKVVFLNHIKNLYNLPVTIHHCRWQNLNINNASVITSRAFAPLTQLLEIINFVSRETNNARGIFLKGEKIKEEIFEAKKTWKFQVEIFQSLSHKTGRIAKVQEIFKK